jgi:hypothetical protein
MIAFDSPEGAALRAMRLSRSAVAALWFTALNEGQDSWSSWASDTLAELPQGRETAALRFIQAASDGDVRRARQFWTILASYPQNGTQGRITRAAQALRASLPL